jgi:hypothetical protein
MCSSHIIYKQIQSRDLDIFEFAIFINEIWTFSMCLVILLLLFLNTIDNDKKKLPVVGGSQSYRSKHITKVQFSLILSIQEYIKCLIIVLATFIFIILLVELFKSHTAHPLSHIVSIIKFIVTVLCCSKCDLFFLENLKVKSSNKY